MTYRDINPKLAGIYVFRNNLNGKCYVGQSIQLRTRIKDHMRNVKKHMNIPIYNAINKYGWHNFTLDILESFIPDPDITNEELIKKLDQLEIKYIEEYEAYTKGYNCTKGGDFGVLGLKMTPEQKKKISVVSKENATRSYKPVYLYNIIDKSTIYAISLTAASHITKIARSCITRAADSTYRYTGNYIAAFSLEELEIKKNNFLIDNTRNKGQFQTKYKVQITDDNGVRICNNVSEAAKYLGFSNSMIYSVLSGYRHINGVTLKKIEQLDRKQAA